MQVEAFLDIETTGLYQDYNQITVVGVHVEKSCNTQFIQLVGEDVTADNLLQGLEGVDVIHTYNGKRFDLPFIYSHLDLNLTELFIHRDLMYDCWQCSLYGGLKNVERQLGIPRRLKGVNGYEAVRLWWRYVNYYDKGALATLLEYNREDVINLKALKEALESMHLPTELTGNIMTAND